VKTWFQAFAFKFNILYRYTAARRHATWTSGYRGVRKHEHKQKGGQVSVKWRAEITVNGKKTSLGYHDTEEKAARAYDVAVRGHSGFNGLRLNFREGDEGLLAGGEGGGAAGALGDAPGAGDAGAGGSTLALPAPGDVAEGDDSAAAAAAAVGDALAAPGSLAMPTDPRAAPSGLAETSAAVAPAGAGAAAGAVGAAGAGGAAGGFGAGVTKSVGGVKEKKVAAAAAAAAQEEGVGVGVNPEGGYLASLAD
jgi:hypothetical protein